MKMHGPGNIKNVAYISILLERPIHVIKAGVNKVRERVMLLRKDLGH
jgi:hypothetical protein